jgi:hypothetical protein
MATQWIFFDGGNFSYLTVSSKSQGLMTTVHAMTATQLTVDGPSRGGKEHNGFFLVLVRDW